MNANEQKLQQALALHRSGNLDRARQLYLEILELEPRNAEAWQLLGVLAYQAGDSRTARGCLEQALKINPNLGPVYQSLGQVLESLNEPQQALAAYRRSLELQPKQPLAWNNLGNLLLNLARTDEAEECLVEARRLDPGNPDILNNLGVLRLAQLRPSEAVPLFEQAVRQKPSYPCFINLGNAFMELRREKQALAAYHQAVQFNPNSPSAYHNLANILHSWNMPVEAVACLRQALALLPPSSDRAENYQSSLAYLMNFLPDISREDLFAEHVLWGEQYGRAERLPAVRRSTDPDRPLRVGYVSPDLRNHAVARFIEPVLAHHDHDLFKIYVYAEVAKPDAMTEKLRGLVDVWRSSVGLDHRALAEQMAADQIDLLVDLAGHTSNHRLLALAHRPAPIQLSWIGYPSTTGLPAMDYYLTDPLLMPPDSQHFFSEELVFLPRICCCFRPPENAPPVGPLPAQANGYITLGSLHRPNKISAAVLDLWSAVMRAIPDSRLLIYWSTLHGESRQVMIERLQERGFPLERVSVEHEAPAEGYMEVYNRIDLGLDVFPWTGGTTTMEALWMGVVVMALRGDRALNRGTMSIVSAIGHPELVAADRDRYVELARELAGNPERLAALRAGMRERVDRNLCDAPRFTRELEGIYRELWQRWCGSHPDGI